MRGSICKQTFRERQALENRSVKMKKKYANLKKFYIENSLKKTRRKELLDLLNKESKHWFNYENIESALKTSILIPNNLNYQSDYFVRLQEKAMLFIQGQYEEIEEYNIDGRVIHYKNSKLKPVFMSMINILGELRKNELERIYEEFKIATYGLKESSISNEMKEVKQNELTELYQLLIAKIKRDINKPDYKLKFMREKLILIYNLLLSWREYVDMLNTPIESYKEEFFNEKRK